MSTIHDSLPEIIEFENTLSILRERFHAYVEKWRSSGWKYADTQADTQPGKVNSVLDNAIVDAAIYHFERQPFSESDMASYLFETGKWPNGGSRPDVRPREVNNYCHQRLSHLIDSLGNAKFRIKRDCPPVAPGFEGGVFREILLEADKVEAVRQCGCRCFREPNNSLSIVFCDKHRD